MHDSCDNINNNKRVQWPEIFIYLSTSSNEHSSWGLFPSQASRLSSLLERWSWNMALWHVETCSVAPKYAIAAWTQPEENCSTAVVLFYFKHLKKMLQKTYNISRSELDAYRFLHVQLHLVTRASLEPIKIWNPVRQISRNAPKCRYQTTWAQEIGFACTKHHKTTAAYVPIKFCKCASFREFETWSTNWCLNMLQWSLTTLSNFIMCYPDPALCLNCWLCWAKVSGRS